MKRHILTLINVEYSIDDDNADETQNLLQAQEQEDRATHRFKHNILFIVPYEK